MYHRWAQCFRYYGNSSRQPAGNEEVSFAEFQAAIVSRHLLGGTGIVACGDVPASLVGVDFYPARRVSFPQYYGDRVSVVASRAASGMRAAAGADGVGEAAMPSCAAGGQEIR